MTPNSIPRECDTCGAAEHAWPTGLAAIGTTDGMCTTCPGCVDWRVVFENYRVDPDMFADPTFHWEFIPDHGTYDVWHANTLYNDKGQPTGIAGSFGWALALFPDQFTHVATVTATDLSDLFQKTNHITESWTRNEGVTMHTSARRARSSSVGDVFIDTRWPTVLWIVAPEGFRSITRDTLGPTTISKSY